MKDIFDKIELPHLALKNQLVRSATWLALCDDAGRFDGRLVPTYRALAAGGVGAIVTGFTSVSADDVFFGQARLANAAHVAEHRRLTEAVHEFATPVIAQLALHDGPRDPADAVPQFVAASRLAAAAGYDGMQIHAAHGFYLSRAVRAASAPAAFLSNLADRMRTAAPSLHLTMKMNCNDLAPERGLDVFAEVAGHLDSIEVSGNGTSVPGIRAGRDEAYFLPFAAALAERISAPVILVGGHRSVESMNQVLNTTKVECLSLSRPLMREPDLPNRWRRGDRAPSLCVSCNLCYNTPAHVCAFKQKKGNKP